MRPLRGAVIGYGFISENGHLPAYSAPSKVDIPLSIVAVADTCPERRRRAQDTLPGVTIYEDYMTLLEREGTKLDFVDVTTPPHQHAPIAHAALDRGLHVICEKPLATSTEDARSLLSHAERAKRVLFPCHNYKHAPVIRAVREVLDAGLIGKVRLVTLQTFRNTHAKGVKEWKTDWRREKQYSGGGIAMDHGSHTFYLAFDWFGAYPSAITAKMSTLGSFDTEDNFSCAMEFPNGTATAHLTWTAGVRKVIYTIHGEKGAVRVEDDDVEVAIMGDPEGDGRIKWELKNERISSDWMDASHVTWFRSMFDQFVEAVKRSEYVGKEARDSLKCIELISTAYESALTGSKELPLRNDA